VIKHIILLSLLAVLSGCHANYPVSELPINLWSGVAPGSEGQTSPEVNGTQVEPDSAYVEAITFAKVTNINTPSLTVYFPDPKINRGCAVIIAPGGGHQFLAIEHEGYAVARALAEQGVTACVLKYRLSKEPNSPYKLEVHSLMDIQRAIKLVRARADNWNINPTRIGVMGFSAGGELAYLAATRYSSPVPERDDAISKLNCRPDFAALLYPGSLNKYETEPLPKDMPPEFLSCAYNDRPVNSINLTLLYAKLKTANIPAEIHIYNSGGHGFGVRPNSVKPVSHWPEVFVAWLADRGLMSGK